MAQHGGKRPGAGRKRGSPNKATQEQRKAVEASGITPLEYLLGVVRNESADPVMRMDAAHKAAPYVHPKLSAVDHSSKDGSMTPQPVLDVSRLSTAALSEIAALGDEPDAG